MAKILIPLLFLTSCGINHNHKVNSAKMTVETKQQDPYVVQIDNKLIEAASFCDERYGYKTPEAEECFKDFRNYFNLTLELDDQLILASCISRYQDNDAIQACVQDLENYYKEQI